MLADGIRLTSSTGGTGALTCSAQTGWASPANAFTGTRYIQYAIAEYSSGAKTQLVNLETGIGSYVTSTNVLTRTLVLSTWNGTTYLPNPGSAAAPSALSFGTASANIDVTIAPIAGGQLPALPFLMAAAAGLSDGAGTSPLNMLPSGSATLGSGVVYYVPILWAMATPLSQFSFYCITGTTLSGGAPTMDCAVYEIGSDGKPGKRLIAFTRAAGIFAPSTLYISAALATPVALTPGWYYQGVLFQAGGATGVFKQASGLFLGTSPMGSYLGVPNSIGVATQTALNDPATAPTAASSIIPLVMMK